MSKFMWLVCPVCGQEFKRASELLEFLKCVEEHIEERRVKL